MIASVSVFLALSIVLHASMSETARTPRALVSDLYVQIYAMLVTLTGGRYTLHISSIAIAILDAVPCLISLLGVSWFGRLHSTEWSLGAARSARRDVNRKRVFSERALLATSCLVFVLLQSAFTQLSYHTLPSQLGWLPAWEWLSPVFRDRVPGFFMWGLSLAPLRLPAFLATLCFYVWIGRRLADRPRDGHLHCLSCDYILDGLPGSRCPECGAEIVSQRT